MFFGLLPTLNSHFEALLTMSSINKIISKKIVSSIVKDGKSVLVSAATETSEWKRPDSVAEHVGGLLKESLANWTGSLPEGTKEVCSR